ncbi:hypothetical protein BMI86_05855 [Thioclava sp. DLFJ5-1]|nr:hypothetical protein BMI86_05855 [Thioclava sp. DLFJ5-1]
MTAVDDTPKPPRAIAAPLATVEEKQPSSLWDACQVSSLAPLELSLLLRLAATFETTDCIDALFAKGAVTFLTGASGIEMEAAAKVFRQFFLPRDFVPEVKASMKTEKAIAFSVHVLRGHPRSGVVGEFDDLLRDGEPLLIVVPSELSLPDGMQRALPSFRLAPLSRDVVLAQLQLTYAPSSLAELRQRLPEDAEIAKLTATALALAFRASNAEDAARRLATAVPQTITPTKTPPTLDDISGEGEALLAARRMVSDLRLWKAGEVAWADVTRSMLLFGPPGTGKTYIARAMGQSAEAKFVFASFAAWQAAGHLGQMLEAMRTSFQEARTTTPSILFIDEIDAVGSRADNDQHSRNYRRQVINGVLEEIDKTAQTEGVLLIGATNDRDAIDPAVLRPGRFDLHVPVTHPDRKLLLGILRSHFDAPNDQLSPIARDAVGMSAADLDAAIRSAKSVARAEGRRLEVADLKRGIGATQHVDPQALWRAALHEIGHAIVFTRLGLGMIRRVCLTQKGGGEIFPLTTATLQTPADFEDELTFLLAGRAAEKLELGAAGAGAGGDERSDLALATRRCIDIETRFGLGYHELVWQDAPDATLLQNPHVYERVSDRLATLQIRAMRILQEHRRLLQDAARRLAEEREIGGETLAQLLGPPRARPFVSLRTFPTKKRPIAQKEVDR